MRNLIALLLLCLPALAQRGVYVYEKKTVLSGSAEVVTLRLPAGSGTVTGISASLQSSSACEMTLERGGTAATETAGEGIGVDSRWANAPRAIPHHTSDAGAGAVLFRSRTGSETLDIRNIGLRPGEQLTIRTASCSATVYIAILWRED